MDLPVDAYVSDELKCAARVCCLRSMEKRMKTLLLLRHAKASRQDTSTRDFDRPLSERGVGDSKLIGEFIRKKKIHPALMISSPAERARQTAELVLKAGLQLELRVDERVYEASARHLF